MIKYALRCARSHEFEAWFANSAAFDTLSAAGQVECPICGDTSVVKRLMAPAIGRAAAPAAEPSAEAPPETPTPPAPAPDASPPAPMASAPEVRRRFVESRLRALRAMVESTAEPVGRRFAEEARAIHDGEAPERPIYGDATPEEAEALADEGVPAVRIPWIERRDD